MEDNESLKDKVKDTLQEVNKEFSDPQVKSAFKTVFEVIKNLILTLKNKKDKAQ
jgi:hypothetical protein